MRKFALVSHILPPSPSGQAIVLYHLLQDIPAEDYYLLSVENYGQADGNMATRKLPAPYFLLQRRKPFHLYYLSPPANRHNGLYNRLSVYGIGTRWAASLILETYRRAREIYKI